MALQKRSFDWWISPAGRNFSFGVISATTVGCIAAKFLPNTLALDKYHEFLASYRDGVPLEVPNHVQNTFDKTLDILEIPDLQRRYLKPFTVFGFDILSIGSAFTKWGALIGIPESFGYISKDTIDKKRITVNNEPVKWNSEQADKLLDALVLSENAQKFAIAREILEKRSYKFFFDISFAPLAIISTYSIAQFYNKALNFYDRPRQLRITFYTLLSLLGVGMYCFMKDLTQVRYDTNLDQTLCEKDPLFVYGGAEFYEKTVQRNIALRNLLGKEGEKAYSVYGNENFFIRQKRLPVVARKLYFQTKLQELNGKEEEAVV